VTIHKGSQSPYKSSHLSNIAFMGKLLVHWKSAACNRKKPAKKIGSEKKSPKKTHKQNVIMFNYPAQQ